MYPEPLHFVCSHVQGVLEKLTQTAVQLRVLLQLVLLSDLRERKFNRPSLLFLPTSGSLRAMSLKLMSDGSTLKKLSLLEELKPLRLWLTILRNVCLELSRRINYIRKGWTQTMRRVDRIATAMQSFNYDLKYQTDIDSVTKWPWSGSVQVSHRTEIPFKIRPIQRS